MTSKPNDYLQNILVRAAASAEKGELRDDERVALYRMALSVAGEEFHRIATNGSPDSVTPEVLMLLQSIGLLCDEHVDPDKLVRKMIKVMEGDNAEEAEDSRDGIEDAS